MLVVEQTMGDLAERGDIPAAEVVVRETGHCGGGWLLVL